MRVLKLAPKPLHEKMKVAAVDEAGPGGANHVYEVDVVGQTTTVINFQKGPVNEAGTNGVSDESLLAILIDRLRGFQSGPFKSRQGACALTKLEEAAHWLEDRTRERIDRGVEGYNKA